MKTTRSQKEDGTTIKVGLKTLTYRCFRPYYYLTNHKLEELYEYKKIELETKNKFLANSIFELETIKEEIAIRQHKDCEKFNKEWKAHYLIRCKGWEEKEKEELFFAKVKAEKENIKVKEIEDRIARVKKQRELIHN